MDLEHKHQDDTSLDRLLQEWVVSEPLPPRFDEQVWHRIRRAETEPQASIWALMARLITVVVPRPKVACSYITVLLVVGVVAGAWEAQRQNNRLDSALGSRYLQSVNPFQAAAQKP